MRDTPADHPLEICIEPSRRMGFPTVGGMSEVSVVLILHPNGHVSWKRTTGNRGWNFTSESDDA